MYSRHEEVLLTLVLNAHLIKFGNTPPGFPTENEIREALARGADALSRTSVHEPVALTWARQGLEKLLREREIGTFYPATTSESGSAVPEEPHFQALAACLMEAANMGRVKEKNKAYEQVVFMMNAQEVKNRLDAYATQFNVEPSAVALLFAEATGIAPIM